MKDRYLVEGVEEDLCLGITFQRKVVKTKLSSEKMRK